MANIIVGCAKYMMIVFIAIYTYQCFAVFGYEDPKAKRKILRNQNRVMFMIHFMAFAGMYLKIGENKILIFLGKYAIIIHSVKTNTVRRGKPRQSGEFLVRG